MNTIVFTPIILILDAIGLAAVLGMGYYGFRMIRAMKRGLLEQSWQYMTMGSVTLLIGVCLFVIGSFIPGRNNVVNEYIFETGTGLVTMGAVSLFLGFRSHDSVWTSFNPKMADIPEKQE